MTIDQLTAVDIPPALQNLLDEVFPGYTAKVYCDPYRYGGHILIIRRSDRSGLVEMRWDDVYAGMLQNDTDAFRQGIANPIVSSLESSYATQ